MQRLPPAPLGRRAMIKQLDDHFHFFLKLSQHDTGEPVGARPAVSGHAARKGLSMPVMIWLTPAIYQHFQLMTRRAIISAAAGRASTPRCPTAAPPRARRQRGRGGCRATPPSALASGPPAKTPLPPAPRYNDIIIYLLFSPGTLTSASAITRIQTLKVIPRVMFISHCQTHTALGLEATRATCQSV